MNRQLDTKVAAVVFGWRSVGGNFMPADAAAEAIRTGVVMDFHYVVPSYYEDPRSAQSIIKHMVADGWQYRQVTSENGTTAQFVCNAEARGRYSADAPTIEMAICLAAVKAKEAWP